MKKTKQNWNRYLTPAKPEEIDALYKEVMAPEEFLGDGKREASKCWNFTSTQLGIILGLDAALWLIIGISLAVCALVRL